MCVLTVSETKNFVFFLLFKFIEWSFLKEKISWIGKKVKISEQKWKQEYKSERSLSANFPQKIKMVVLNQNLEP